MCIRDSSIAEGTSEISGFLKGEDCLATINAFKKMGVKIEDEGKKIYVHGVGLRGLKKPIEDLDLGNSGTSMRLLGLLSGQKFSSTLIGDSSLSSRPMKRILEPLQKMGASIFAKDNTAPLSIKTTNKLSGISYEMPIASAQVKSCILLAGLYADSNTQVIENHLTRDHTEKMFKKFGIEIDENFKNLKKIIRISPPQKLNPSNITIPGAVSYTHLTLPTILLV